MCGSSTPDVTYPLTVPAAICLRVRPGVSLPFAGLWRLPAVRLLPGRLFLPIMWSRKRPVSVPAWCDRSPVQHVWQPVCWSHKFRVWRWEWFVPLALMFSHHLWPPGVGVCLFSFVSQMTKLREIIYLTKVFQNYSTGSCMICSLICHCAQHHISDSTLFWKKSLFHNICC